MKKEKMNLSAALQESYTKEHLTAREAQARAQWIAWAPVVFQASRLMLKWGILDLLRNSHEGLTIAEVAREKGLSVYAVKVLMEASLSIGTVTVDPATGRFALAKTGWFLVNDRATRVNMDFAHDVCYEGMFRLEDALLEGRPAGLEHFGPWPTIYEGLSQLPQQVQMSWFLFDHFYSDGAFQEALKVVFAQRPRTLLDVGGNTGRWALQCVAYDPDVRVTVVDLPQQVELMRQQTEGKPGADRIDAFATDLLNPGNALPADRRYDAVWMSQFLDCFADAEVVSILKRAAKVMDADSRLYILETLWDRQRFDTAAFCLTMTSLYFTAMANGNSKMFSTDDLVSLIGQAGLEVVTIHDHLGLGHSILELKVKGNSTN